MRLDFIGRWFVSRSLYDLTCRSRETHIREAERCYKQMELLEKILDGKASACENIVSEYLEVTSFSESQLQITPDLKKAICGCGKVRPYAGSWRGKDYFAVCCSPHPQYAQVDLTPRYTCTCHPGR